MRLDVVLVGLRRFHRQQI